MSASLVSFLIPIFVPTGSHFLVLARGIQSGKRNRLAVKKRILECRGNSFIAIEIILGSMNHIHIFLS